MDKISKKTIRRIKAGFHDDLMDAIEFLIDTYEEDKFDAGYRSCMEDMSVMAYRLAEYLENSSWITVPGLASIIEDYFNKALNGKD